MGAIDRRGKTHDNCPTVQMAWEYARKGFIQGSTIGRNDSGGIRFDLALQGCGMVTVLQCIGASYDGSALFDTVKF